MDPISLAITAGSLVAKVKTALVIGGSAIAVASISGAQAAIQKSRLKDAAKKARSRVDVMLRSGVEPQRIIYGTRRVSGVLCYANVRLSTGTNDNSDLWQIIALAGHQVSGITDLYLDGDKIDAANIDSTGSTTGGKYAPISGRSPVQVLLNDGADDQTYLNIGFSDWTSAHRLRGIAHIATRFELSTRGSASLWRNGAPTNVRVVVQGKKVYDPRKDSTQTTISGSGSHRLADPTTWEYSANSALVLADYLIDTRLGMGQEGVTSADVDYDLVASAADQCDVSVAIPGGTEARYETHGVLFTTDSHEENIRQLLRPMNGQLTWSNGKFRIRAGEYAAPVLSFTEDDVIGPIAIVTERGRDERANKIRGSYANAAEDYEQMQYLPVENATLKSTRDAGTSLVETIDQGMVTSETQCQRLAIKLLNIGDQQMQATIPLRYTALNCVVGDRVEITVSSCGWSQKIFRVTGWRFSGLTGGFEIDVVEDDSSAYADPAESEYSQRTSSGAITFADPPVPAPSGLTATAERNGILVQWSEPEPPSLFDEVQVFASATPSFANAAQIASTRGTAFFHDLNPGTQRYYWARSIDTVDAVSDRNPNSTTSSVQATAGAVGVADVSGAGDLASQNTVDYATQVTGSERPDNGADVTGDHAADIDVLLTQNAPSEANADRTGNHAADIDVLLTQNAPSEANADRTGNHAADINVLLTQNAPAEAGADVTGDHAADINVLLTQNAPAEAGADVTGDHAADINVLLTQNAPAEANADRTGNHAADINVLLTQNAPSEANADRTANHAADIDVLLTQNAPSEANADRTGNHAADINVLLTQNAPAEAGADVTGDHAADINVLLTQNAPAEAGADVTGDHAADINVLLTQNAPSEANADRTANHSADIDVLQTQNAPAEAGADVTGNHAADINVLLTQNAPAEAGADVTGDHAADINVLDTQNAPAEAGADVTGNHAADINVLNTQNAPVEARATRGLVDIVVAETDGAVTNNSTTTYTEAQSLDLTLTESTVVLISMSGLISRVASGSSTFSQVRALKDGVEIGGVSSYVTFVPGGTGSAAGYLPWNYRRVETLAAGTYTYSFEFRQIAGGVTTRFTNRVITAEEVA